MTATAAIEEVQSDSEMIKLMFKTMNFDSLPEEMVWQILVRVPAQDIFDATLFNVCWKWYKMILSRDFKYAHHLHHSTTRGLLVKDLDNREITYITMRQDGKIDISEFISYNFNCIFWSSCNGLMLEATPGGDSQKLTITNPLTKQRLTLPPFFIPPDAHELYSAIAYAATSMEYKVIRPYMLDAKNSQFVQYCTILTVGVDSSWRIVDTQNLSPTDMKHFYSPPFVTQGFVHWVPYYHCGTSYIMTLNVETEIITMIPYPHSRGGKGILRYHLSAGSCVSVFIALSNFKWEVWEMKPKTGEWTKMPDIDLEDQKKRIISHEHDGECSALGWNLCPAGWLKYPEVIIFVVNKPDNINKSFLIQTQLRVAYNVPTQDIIYFFKLDLKCLHYLVHSNTLLWLDGCAKF